MVCDICGAKNNQTSRCVICGDFEALTQSRVHDPLNAQIKLRADEPMAARGGGSGPLLGIAASIIAVVAISGFLRHSQPSSTQSVRGTNVVAPVRIGKQPASRRPRNVEVVATRDQKVVARPPIGPSGKPFVRSAKASKVSSGYVTRNETDASPRFEQGGLKAHTVVSAPLAHTRSRPLVKEAPLTSARTIAPNLTRQSPAIPNDVKPAVGANYKIATSEYVAAADRAMSEDREQPYSASHTGTQAMRCSPGPALHQGLVASCYNAVSMSNLGFVLLQSVDVHGALSPNLVLLVVATFTGEVKTYTSRDYGPQNIYIATVKFLKVCEIQTECLRFSNTGGKPVQTL